MKKLSQKQFEKSWEHAKWQLEVEGFNVTAEDKEAVRKVCLGEMTREQLIEQLKR